MNNPQWTPIWHYSDAALRRMAASSRDMRANAAAREIVRRALAAQRGASRRAVTSPAVVRDNSIYEIRVMRDGEYVGRLPMHYRRHVGDRIYTGSVA